MALDISFEFFEWASCDYYLAHGKMMPDDWFEQLKGFDALYFGAVGWPDKVPDHISLWGSLLKFRRDFDQYVNIRPVRLFPGVPCPLAGREPGDIDFVVIRENTEGEYSSLGGRMFEGTENEFVLQESVFTRRGVDRILKYAFEVAQTRERKHVTSATKSNGMAVSMPYWDERTAAMAANYPEISWDKQHIDILCARFVLQPDRFDVVVASNLFGDIPVRPRPGLRRHHRHRAIGQPEPRAQVPVAVRAGARLGPGHLRQEHRQPDRDDLVRCADARFPRQRRHRPTLPRCP
ncbi:tartrate dehydrogenase [Pseudomonas putida]|nr:tartrate dehydrogenase [Pseudomonas putida]